MKMIKHGFYLLLALALFAGCQKNEAVKDHAQHTAASGLNFTGNYAVEVQHFENEGPHAHANNRSGFTETFEGDSKGSYAGATVNLGSGDWFLSDALLGTSTRDRKFNSRSVRVRNTGYAIMSFDLPNGASTVRVRHAKYGSDSNTSWRLISSTDGGASWQFAGGTINTTSTNLNTVSFNVNITESVRFGVYRTGGGSNRTNIDNFEVVASGGSSGGNNGGGSTGQAARDNNLTFGNPSDASTSNNNNYLVSATDYAASYNNSRGTANWVSWHLSSAWIGSASRCNCFKRDTRLPSNFFRPTTSNYTNSGFDRGHLCPSADRTYSSTANSNTFYMTNIAPQAPDNNQRGWKNLEDYCRDLVDAGNELHIIAGIAGNGGTGRNGFRSTINNGNIDVPDEFWKVILVLPNGTNDVSRVNTSTRIIAVRIPNDQGISSNWGSFRVSVNSIEALTGYDLFENIDNTIESTLESRVDNGPTN